MRSQIIRYKLDKLFKDPTLYFSTLPERHNCELIRNMVLHFTILGSSGLTFVGTRVDYPNGFVKTMIVNYEDDTNSCTFFADGNVFPEYAEYTYQYKSLSGEYHTVTNTIASGYVRWYNPSTIVHKCTPEGVGPHPSKDELLTFLMLGK